MSTARDVSSEGFVKADKVGLECTLLAFVRFRTMLKLEAWRNIVGMGQQGASKHRTIRIVTGTP